MGSLPFIGGLCGDLSPHRTTMTQTKRCPIFKFGSWWCFSRQTPQESDCEINASFAQGCACVINAARRCGVPATGCCGTGPCLDQSSDGITDHQRQAGLSWRRLAVAKFEVVSARQPLHFCSVQVVFLVVLWPLGCPVRLQPGVNCLWPAQKSITRCR